MLFGLAILLICVLLCSTGAFLVANAICQRWWKERIPQSKLVGFTAVFVAVFVSLGILLSFAAPLVFGR